MTNKDREAVREVSHNGVRVIEVLEDPEDGAIKVISEVRGLNRPSIETGRYVQPSDRIDGTEDVVCLSTQIGCAMRCSFCSSTEPFVYVDGDQPRRLFGSLSADEIVGQAHNALDVRPPLEPDGVVFSYMGMGEPTDNIKEVRQAITELSLFYPNSRSTICTMLPRNLGVRVVKELADYATNMQSHHEIKLHISLHASNDASRSQLLPVAEPISVAVETARYYAERTGTVVKMNYVLVAGANDSADDAHRLGLLLKDTGLTLKVSDLNPRHSPLRVSRGRTRSFTEIVESYGVRVVRFKSDGPIIESGCGQLTKNNPAELRNISSAAIRIASIN